MTVGDLYVAGDHMYRIVGVYHGALHQEGAVEVESLTHPAPSNSDGRITLMIPASLFDWGWSKVRRHD